MSEQNPYRLPRSVIPERYELTLEPDLRRARFDGEVTISGAVVEPTAEIVLNAVDLEIHEASVGGVAATVRLDDATERAFLSLATPVEAGDTLIRLAFSGILNDKLAGFYRSTYKDDEGNEQVIATTQMEATDARRAFPCWDEPDLKATFAVTLVIPDNLLALSNGAEIAREPAGDGKVRVTFAETMRMSTYLVAFVVGPLVIIDPVDVDGTPLRVAHTPGKEHMTDFALEVGAHVLRFYAEWFGVPYPSDKLDLIALPDFAFGAMENLGCVTFRETALLVDRENASRLELERVADVVAHEIAHMWFGDLVTMKWWEGIWLNEAFATFMELLGVDDFRPEWQRWVSFSTSRAQAQLIDGLSATRPIEFPVVRPDDAEGMFDVLTYQKGGAVLRMLQQYLGADAFRDGIRRYIDTHKYSNTATTDLWDAIEAATGEPVRTTMDSWIYQGGHPLVSVDAAADGSSVTFTQRRFRYLPSDDDAAARWAIPLMVRFSTTGGGVERRKMLLTDESITIGDLSGKPEWIVANDGGWGFFRTRYSPELLRRLTANLDALTAVERFNLVSDTWAAVLSGHSDVSDFVELVGVFGEETDPDVWAAILAPFDAMERALVAQGAGTEGLAYFVRTLARPAFDRLTWDPQPGEDERTGTLRASLVGALGTIGADEEIRAEATRRFERFRDDRGAIAPDLVAPVVTLLSRTGDEARYTEFLDRYRNPETPQQEVRYLLALCGFPHEGLFRRTADMLLTPEVRSQNGMFLVTSILANPRQGKVAWAWLKEHWDAVREKLPDNTHSRMLEGVTTLADPETAADIDAWLESHPVAGGKLAIPQLRERLRVGVAFRQRNAEAIAAAFEA
ncbi:MAG: M1 family metallopeptidase [Acidimicrobiia bacterium]